MRVSSALCAAGRTMLLEELRAMPRQIVLETATWMRSPRLITMHLVLTGFIGRIRMRVRLILVSFNSAKPLCKC